MIAPVYTQNAIGRSVYLPEEMVLVRFKPDGIVEQTKMEPGHYFTQIPLNEVILFVRKDKCIPLAEPAECVADINMEQLSFVGYENSSYRLYNDDGYTRTYDLDKGCITVG